MNSDTLSEKERETEKFFESAPSEREREQWLVLRSIERQRERDREKDKSLALCEGRRKCSLFERKRAEREREGQSKICVFP